MEKKVLVIGTGDQARVVSEVLRAGERTVAGWVVPKDQKKYPRVSHVTVWKWGDAEAHKHNYEFVVGVGDNSQRRKLQEAGESSGFVFTCAVHPASVLGKGVKLGAGSVVAAGALVVLDSELGKGVIINTGAQVDHDCRIGDWSHIGPGAVLAGAVVVGPGAFLGAGSVAVNGVKVGRNAKVGAGGSVINDVADGELVGGVPARPLKRMDPK